MKFAFLVMGNYHAAKDRAAMPKGTAQIIGVADLEEACAVAKALCAEGVGCIELCGAFGETGARAVVEATNNQIPIGYVTHLPEQDDVYEAAFSGR